MMSFVGEGAKGRRPLPLSPIPCKELKKPVQIESWPYLNRPPKGVGRGLGERAGTHCSLVLPPNITLPRQEWTEFC